MFRARVRVRGGFRIARSIPLVLCVLCFIIVNLNSAGRKDEI